MGKDCGEKSNRRQQREQKIEPLDASFSVFSVLSCSCFTNSSCPFMCLNPSSSDSIHILTSDVKAKASRGEANPGIVTSSSDIRYQAEPNFLPWLWEFS